MSANPQSSFDALSLESWEESALDRTEAITDNFNEQARGDTVGQSEQEAAYGSSSDSGSGQASAAAAGLEREPYEDEAAYDTADEATQEADYDGGYDGPGL